MEVILLERIQGLGERGSRVQVAPGYARNFLLPRRLAVAATRSGEAVFSEELRIRGRRDDKRRADAEQMKRLLDGVAVRIRAQASDEGKLYGSVTANEIAAQLAEMGRDIDRKTIHLEEPIKQVGDYDTEIRLAPEVKATIKVVVEKSD